MIRVYFSRRDLSIDTLDFNKWSDAIVDISTLARDRQLIEVLDVIEITSMGVEDVKLRFLSELKA